jgi:glutamate dehydrogenase/leucine dehydrogenase
MKIVVIGGTGLIGSKTVAILRQGGHEVVAASPNTGVNTITGEGLNSSRPPAATFSRRRPQPASGTMSRYPSSEPTGRPKMAISAPRSPKRN